MGFFSPELSHQKIRVFAYWSRLFVVTGVFFCIHRGVHATLLWLFRELKATGYVYPGNVHPSPFIVEGDEMTVVEMLAKF